MGFAVLENLVAACVCDWGVVWVEVDSGDRSMGKGMDGVGGGCVGAGMVAWGEGVGFVVL